MNITGIVALDDNAAMKYIPWEQSLLSSFNIADRLVVVYGGTKNEDRSQPVLQRLKRMRNIRVVYFDWPAQFDWRQFSKSYAYGRYFAVGDWCMFFTVDELFPEGLKILKKIAALLPPFVDYISIWRNFLLNEKYCVKYAQKRILFKNKKEITFGIVNHLEPPQSSIRDFGRLINAQKWFDGRKYIDISKKSIVASKNYRKQLEEGRIIKGFRDRRLYKTLPLPYYYINTHSLFMPDKYLIQSYRRSLSGYNGLPKGYEIVIDFPLEDDHAVKKSYLEKVERQLHKIFIDHVKCVEPDFPLNFRDRIGKDFIINESVDSLIKKYENSERVG